MNPNPQMKEIEEQDKRIEENLDQIKNRIVIFSGKGGVGKTTVSVNLAYTLVQAGMKVGLLDADITGPNVPRMAGVDEAPNVVGDRQFSPHLKDGLQIISIAPMIPKEQPVIWRGPLRSGAISQFLADVFWGELDYLLADLPPGTGDEVLTAAQKMKPQIAVIVTTPQEVSLMDCRRAVNMAKKLHIPHIAVVENMAGFVCPHCGEAIDLFGKDGGPRMAEEMDVHYWGSIPIEPAIREGGDTGKPVVLHYPESETTKSFEKIKSSLTKMLSED